MNAETLPTVDLMMIRRFTPRLAYPVDVIGYVGGVFVMTEYEVDEVGLADKRLDFDDEAIDCSNRIFQITTQMMMTPDLPSLTVFPSRRFRNFRTDQAITGSPNETEPLLYLGNPVRLLRGPRGLEVIGRGEFTIKSGPELGY